MKPLELEDLAGLAIRVACPGSGDSYSPCLRTHGPVIGQVADLPEERAEYLLRYGLGGGSGSQLGRGGGRLRWRPCLGFSIQP